MKLKAALPILVLAGAFLAPSASQAKPAWVKQAQDLGFKDVTNCQYCHAKPPALGEVGKWLVDQKAKRKATAVDLNWLKDYKKS